MRFSIWLLVFILVVSATTAGYGVVKTVSFLSTENAIRTIEHFHHGVIEQVPAGTDDEVILDMVDFMNFAENAYSALIRAHAVIALVGTILTLASCAALIVVYRDRAKCKET